VFSVSRSRRNLRNEKVTPRGSADPDSGGTRASGASRPPATRRGSDYSGKEVHVAARSVALAGGGEILASAATASLAETRPASEPRSVSLKGVSGDVNIASIAW
jgi:class 3 adenylate cyclase